MSNFQKQQELLLEQQLESMIVSITGFIVPSKLLFKPSQKNYEIAHKYALSNLKYHRFADPDSHLIQSKFSNLLVKLQVMCKPETADFLNELFSALKDKPFSKDYQDVPFRILDFLMYLSSNIIEVNQHREPNRSILKKQKIETLSVSSIDSLKQWEFEESSESEQATDSDDEVIYQKQQKQPEPAKEQRLPNILWHLQCPQKRTFTEFLNTCEVDIKGYQLFKPENQNRTQNLTNRRIVSLIAQEKDLVCALLYSFQGIKSELLILSGSEFILGDFEITHMSHESLQRSVAEFLELANSLIMLRRSESNFERRPSLTRVEDLIQEQFWIAVGEIILEFEREVADYLRQIVFHGKEFESSFNEPITLIQLHKNMSSWIKVFRQLKEIAKFREKVDSSLFSSPTLTKLYQCCIENQLQPLNYQIQCQRVFLGSLDPYLRLIDKFLDYNSHLKDDFQNVPPFLEPCIKEMKNIGLAYQIFMKIQVPALKQIKFRENFIKSICQQTCVTEPELPRFRLSGGFNMSEAFSLKKLDAPQLAEAEIKFYSLKSIRNADMIKIFQREISKQIRSEDQQIQNILIGYLNKNFLQIHQHLRCLFFFERADMIEFLFVKSDFTESSVRILQNQLIEALNKLYELPIQLTYKQRLSIKVQLPHPIDLIIDENAFMLLNSIMQFLRSFKHAKGKLVQTQIYLKKRLQNKLRPFLYFANELMNFMQNYEYFLFQSIIQLQTRKFLENYSESRSLDQIIELHNSYLKAISDKMFLSQKSKAVLDAINKILDVTVNFPVLAERAMHSDSLEKIQAQLEWNRVYLEFQRICEQFKQQISALILLFDTNIQRFAHAPEIIECMLKVNFNQFYKL